VLAMYHIGHFSRPAARHRASTDSAPCHGVEHYESSVAGSP
jgi:hypothetical protein